MFVRHVIPRESSVLDLELRLELNVIAHIIGKTPHAKKAVIYYTMQIPQLPQKTCEYSAPVAAKHARGVVNLIEYPE